VAVQETITEQTEYQLILVLAESRKVLAIRDVDGYRLPSVAIPQWTRPAQQLQAAVLAVWGLPIFIVDFLLQGFSRYAIAEALAPSQSTKLKPTALEEIQAPDLSRAQRARIDSMFGCDVIANNSISHVGWINEASAWVEAETGRKLSPKCNIEQYNAGGGFALLRFHMVDGGKYWLKATGAQNAHEPSITIFLSKLSGDYLPECVATKPEWNAWLMSGDATSLKLIPTTSFELSVLLEDAVEGMARLQIKTLGYDRELINAGAFDQRIETFRKHSEELFDYLGEAMDLQTSTKTPRLTRSRLYEMHTIFDDVCNCMKCLDLPETIVHGDINSGNILIAGGHCQFIDWAEAYVGNPLISLQHLLLLNKWDDPELQSFRNRALKDRYRAIWLESCNPDVLDQGFAYMPLMAIVSALYGRGDWLTSQRRNDPHRQSYTRSLTRHMDRITREPELLGALCH
jgi:Phosphotransferase enzyme family